MVLGALFMSALLGGGTVKCCENRGNRDTSGSATPTTNAVGQAGLSEGMNPLNPPLQVPVSAERPQELPQAEANSRGSPSAPVHMGLPEKTSDTAPQSTLKTAGSGTVGSATNVNTGTSPAAARIPVEGSDGGHQADHGQQAASSGQRPEPYHDDHDRHDRTGSGRPSGGGAPRPAHSNCSHNSTSRKRHHRIFFFHNISKEYIQERLRICASFQKSSQVDYNYRCPVCNACLPIAAFLEDVVSCKICGTTFEIDLLRFKWVVLSMGQSAMDQAQSSSQQAQRQQTQAISSGQGRLESYPARGVPNFPTREQQNNSGIFAPSSRYSGSRGVSVPSGVGKGKSPYKSSASRQPNTAKSMIDVDSYQPVVQNLQTQREVPYPYFKHPVYGTIVSERPVPPASAGAGASATTLAENQAMLADRGMPADLQAALQHPASAAMLYQQQVFERSKAHQNTEEVGNVVGTEVGNVVGKGDGSVSGTDPGIQDTYIRPRAMYQYAGVRGVGTREDGKPSALFEKSKKGIPNVNLNLHLASCLPDNCVSVGPVQPEPVDVEEASGVEDSSRPGTGIVRVTSNNSSGQPQSGQQSGQPQQNDSFHSFGDFPLTLPNLQQDRDRDDKHASNGNKLNIDVQFSEYHVQSPTRRLKLLLQKKEKFAQQMQKREMLAQNRKNVMDWKRHLKKQKGNMVQQHGSAGMNSNMHLAMKTIFEDQEARMEELNKRDFLGTSLVGDRSSFLAGLAHSHHQPEPEVENNELPLVGFAPVFKDYVARRSSLSQRSSQQGRSSYQSPRLSGLSALGGFSDPKGQSQDEDLEVASTLDADVMHCEQCRFVWCLRDHEFCLICGWQPMWLQVANACGQDGGMGVPDGVQDGVQGGVHDSQVRGDRGEDGLFPPDDSAEKNTHPDRNSLNTDSEGTDLANLARFCYGEKRVLPY